MIRLTIYTIFFTLITACNFDGRRDQLPAVLEQDLKTIREKGRITVITDYSSTDYFVYKGQPLGFQYEMLQQLANHLSVRLEVRVSRNIIDSYEMLRLGEADLIAQNLMVTPYGKSFVDYTNSHMRAYQVLVQRKPDNWSTLSEMEIQSSLVTRLQDLKGKTVYVMRGSAYAERLNELSKALDGQLRVTEVDESMEELIYLVSIGEIPFTVSDNSVAEVNMRYYPNLDIGTPLSKKLDVSWALRKGSTNLQQEINAWMDAFSRTRRYRELYARYFENDRSARIVESDFYAINTGKISPYDQYIRKYSEELGWDWRLLASMIYQESNFRSNAISIAGASGLMQLMPSTAERFGLGPASPVSEQIRAGTDFIRILTEEVFSDVKDPDERVKFVLAAYNIGPGHIIDARNLARKNGADPDKWDDNVARFLLSKSDPRYYKDPVVKFGFCKGNETFRYVTEVLERYEHYRNIVEK